VATFNLAVVLRGHTVNKAAAPQQAGKKAPGDCPTDGPCGAATYGVWG
jgi:hypothetical protein